MTAALRSFVLWVALCIVLAMTVGCRRPTQAAGVEKRAPARIHFKESTREAGIDFVHVNGAYGRKLMPETVGSGCALADFDNDGNLDLLIVNGTNWPGHATKSGTCHLYKGDGHGHFRDVTAGSGLDVPIYGMGVAVADYDGDGKEDIYLTAVGPNRLLHNDGNMHFTDVTAKAGVAGVPAHGLSLEDKWSTSAAWLDYNRDGNVDLFVCQYVRWSPQLDPFCGKNGVRGYCPPDNFEGVRCTLYRNNGDGTFTDVTREIGLLDGAVGKSFGIGIGDFNNDGYPDIVVTNDTWANFLFINEVGKRFVEQGVESGIAFGENGQTRAGMGIDVADFQNNGRPGFVIGNFVDQGLSLYEAEPEGLLFTDRAQEMGVSASSLLDVTFGTFFFDADLDGWQDLFAANGHVDDIANVYRSDISFRQEPILLHNVQGKRFVNVTRDAGLMEKMVGRGAACGDIDGDGLLDIAVVDNGGHFHLFKNETSGAGNWVRIHLEGTGHNRDALGAHVALTSGGMTQTRYVKSGGSFLSESERTLTFGLGGSPGADKLIVTWPDGKRLETGSLTAGRTYSFKESSQ